MVKACCKSCTYAAQARKNCWAFGRSCHSSTRSASPVFLSVGAWTSYVGSGTMSLLGRLSCPTSEQYADVQLVTSTLYLQTPVQVDRAASLWKWCDACVTTCLSAYPAATALNKKSLYVIYAHVVTFTPTIVFRVGLVWGFYCLARFRWLQKILDEKWRSYKRSWLLAWLRAVSWHDVLIVGLDRMDFARIQPGYWRLSRGLCHNVLAASRIGGDCRNLSSLSVWLAAATHRLSEYATIRFTNKAPLLICALMAIVWHRLLRHPHLISRRWRERPEMFATKDCLEFTP